MSEQTTVTDEEINQEAERLYNAARGTFPSWVDIHGVADYYRHIARESIAKRLRGAWSGVPRCSDQSEAFSLAGLIGGERITVYQGFFGHSIQTEFEESFITVDLSIENLRLLRDHLTVLINADTDAN